MGVRSYVRDRKAVKASRAGESANTIAAIGAMAKQGTLRATTTSPGQRNFGRAERAAVREEVAKSPDWGSRGDRFDKAAARVDKASDVNGYDGPANRKRDAERNATGKQEKKYLPKEGM